MSEKAMLVDRLIAEIQAGNYKPNDKLPSENELADDCNVPRIVVRKAYERLQELGYIFSVQGKGSYVQNKKLQIPLILTGDTSFSEKMRELNYDFETKNLACEKIPYDSFIYHVLRVKKEETVYKISRLRVVEGYPIAVHTSFLSQSTFTNIEREGTEITSTFHYYRQHGYTEFEPMKSQLSVIFPTKKERELLKCPSLVPLLLLESGCTDRKSGTVLEYSKIMYRSDCFTYLI
ncbi:GntR family transcriptional regulator [Alkalihalobacillus oceani]|uniref:GntR family transcriptional regulator n=1 Tax=Halalkalibacter oceani TaxID=1653776 RepID=A0A9X2DS25_9BACI|nr:GntR family transcriptional regulator [Halalkalibacter oceani]MCM3714402.1 GntR family transcriptional regulator [Halalkalibacter oceani]